MLILIPLIYNALNLLNLYLCLLPHSKSLHHHTRYLLLPINLHNPKMPGHQLDFGQSQLGLGQILEYEQNKNDFQNQQDTINDMTMIMSNHTML